MAFSTRNWISHNKNETPHHAVTLCAVLTFAFAAIFGWLGLGVLDIFNDFSTIATFGFPHGLYHGFRGGPGLPQVARSLEDIEYYHLSYFDSLQC